jgi:hypothetical protein
LDAPVLDLNDMIAGATDKTSISATPQKLPPHWSFRRFRDTDATTKASIPATSVRTTSSAGFGQRA